MSAFNGEIWYNLLMAEIPKTSVSLLTVLANDTANARWFEFYNAYEGPMRAFLASKYPALEADDIVQETTRVCHFIFRKVRFEPMFTRAA